MKNINIKIYLLVLIILVSVLPVLSQKDSPPPWTYKNTGSNHTLLMSNNIPIYINSLPIDSGDYIGVFYDSLGTLKCAGFTMWQNTTTALAAWGADSGLDGFATGETFKWKIWDSSQEIAYRTLATYNGEDFFSYDTYESNGMSGITSLYGYPEQEIDLNKGWNFISSYINPFENSWDSVLSDIDSLVVGVYDFKNTQYWPVITSEFSTMSAAKPYKIKMISNATINLFGTQLLPSDTSFDLSNNMQALPYIRTNDASVLDLFDVQSGSIKLIKSETGELYWPEMFSSEFVNLETGKAYQIITFDSIEFTYLKNDTVLNLDTENPPTQTQYYTLDLNTGNNMSLAILQTAWDTMPIEGDEIGIFSESGIIMGAGVYHEQNIAITIWGDDETTTEVEGLVSGENFTVKLWNHLTGFEDIIVIENWLDGDSIYLEDKVSIIEKIKVEQQEAERNYNLQIYSNPINNSYQFFISLPEDTYVKLNLININGQFVENIVADYLNTGKHPYNYNYSHLHTGIYFVRMETTKINIVKKIYIIKYE